MKFLLTPIGSHGDIHPFLALGKELHRRGHEVIVITGSLFREPIERLNLHFVELFSGDQIQEIIHHPDLWKPLHGPKLMIRWITQAPLQPLYEAISKHHEPGRTIVVHSPLGIGARIAHDKLGVPLATIHLAPMSLRSVAQPARQPRLNLPSWSPYWTRRFFNWMIDRWIIDPLVCPEINRFRATLQLPAIRRVANGWWDSPQLILALFPDWFAPSAPDWPAQVRQTGFPLYDQADTKPLTPELETYLQAGEPPILFTPGSANAQAKSFFESAVNACERLRQRGLLVTHFPEQVPQPLPPQMRYMEYVPFSQVFPRCATVVHHGGIGTLSQALAAGVPQLIMPLSFDQYDNAAHVKRLGAGDELLPTSFTGPRLADSLAALKKPEVRQRCREIASRFAGLDAIAKSCDYLEGMGDVSAPTSPRE